MSIADGSAEQKASCFRGDGDEFVGGRDSIARSCARQSGTSYDFRMTAAEMEQIIEAARQRSRTMTRADLEQQARSFAAGNAGIEDPRINSYDRAVGAEQGAPRGAPRHDVEATC